MFVKRSVSLLVKPINNVSSVRNLTSSSSVYEAARRKRDRKGLVNEQQIEESDVSYFPMERQGVDYELNWTLNRYSITPTFQAFRNASEKVLFQQSQGKKEANGQISVQVASETKSTNYYLDAEVAKTNNGNVISVAQYKQLLELVKDHIGTHKSIFVGDAALGSSRAVEAHIRTVTGDATNALYLNHILPRTLVGKVGDFKHPITLYLAPSLVVDSPQQYGLVGGQAFNIIDIKRGIAVIAGAQSTENIRKTLSAISQAHFVSTQTLSTSADIYRTHDNKNILVFNDGYLLNKKFESGSVVSQGSLWNKDGVYRIFDAISYPLESPANKKFDVIERFASPKKTVSTTPVQFDTNEYAAPSDIVFMVKDSKGIIPPFSQLDASQAENFFTAGYNGDSFQPFATSEPITTSPKAKAELFKSLVEQNKSNVYIINTHSFQKDADVDKLLSVISSGKVTKPQSKSQYQILSPIQLSENKVGQVDSAKINEFETNFATFLSKFKQ
ncbi:hypothetical protein DFA_01455 [Cavenderia fasciculata]|uniref:phosphoenolpyruvate carboxykinase (ATP) n=1 Tax=Cavenderia fasciculata TaxID=261658 RepID=F4PSU1_CACFS|nr:uncharacterized protein DFA_01455 [Cavenderia fasciculata]EGG21569.1 hypothetical protein DFA_01455 [Cavenderia fasciculata]|eukprot:XP_004359419.1 hypothetical protein DFA_01455 [Cavenderia fasciculata]